MNKFLFLSILIYPTLCISNTYSFNESCYLKRYPDVAQKWGGKPIDHWNRHGKYEGRISTCAGLDVFTPVAGSGSFNHACYLRRYPDVARNWKGNPLHHWQRHGKREKRNPSCITTIKGIGKLPIAISIDEGKYAAAVTSLQWNGMEFINNYDHGRQLQSAVQVDGYGECNNPTEAGSSHDGKSNSSSSVTLASTSKKNELKTKSRMAFWKYKGTTGACKKGKHPNVTSPLSQHELEKTITMGALFSDQRITKYSLKFFHKNSLVKEKMTYEFLTGYLNGEFKKIWYVDLLDERLKLVQNSDLVSIAGNGFPNGSFIARPKGKNHFDPIIMSTSNNQHAMGVYVSRKSIQQCGSRFHGYNAYYFNLGGSGTNGRSTAKWSLAVDDDATSSCIRGDNQWKNRSFDVYTVVGNVNEVRSRLVKIAKHFGELR